MAASTDSTQEFAFEGPEKNLEIDLVVKGDGGGARRITKEQWDTILDEAKCKILSIVANDHFTSYVLSESSLFVYDRKIVIKTCGTTTLLLVLPKLLAVFETLSIAVEWIGYSRKDFSRPLEQVFPHTSFTDEVMYARAFFPEVSGYILGPVMRDHWAVLVADYCDRPPSTATDRTLNIMMYDLHPDTCRLFFKNKDFVSTEHVTTTSGIRDLLPGSIIQDCMFDPCGYSMNGLLGDAYWTIHITPESHCSYASFETNLRAPEYDDLMRRVLDIFRPHRFTATLFADEGGVREMRRSPFALAHIALNGTAPRSGVCVPTAPTASSSGLTSKGAAPLPKVADQTAAEARMLANAGKWTYQRGPQSQTQFEGDYCCVMANWVRLLPSGTRSGPCGRPMSRAAALSMGCDVPRHEGAMSAAEAVASGANHVADGVATPRAPLAASRMHAT